MATWKDLLFGNLVGFSAFVVILMTLLIGLFFLVWFLRISKPPTDGSDTADRHTDSA